MGRMHRQLCSAGGRRMIGFLSIGRVCFGDTSGLSLPSSPSSLMRMSAASGALFESPFCHLVVWPCEWGGWKDLLWQCGGELGGGESVASGQEWKLTHLLPIIWLFKLHSNFLPYLSTMRWVTTVYTRSVSSSSPSMSNRTCETGPCFPAAADILGRDEAREKDVDGQVRNDEASRIRTTDPILLMHRSMWMDSPDCSPRNLTHTPPPTARSRSISRSSTRVCPRILAFEFSL